MCESLGGRPGLQSLRVTMVLCGRKATFEEEDEDKNAASRTAVAR